MSTTPRTTVTPRAVAASDVVTSSPFADYEMIHAQAIRKVGVAENSVDSTAPALIEEEIRYLAGASR